MKALTIKDVVRFRSKSERSKRTFVTNLKLSTEKASTGEERDYWVRGLSAVSSTYKTGDLQIIPDKIDEVEEKLKTTGNTKTRLMYQRNLKILRKYEKFDFKKLKPVGKLTFLKKQNSNTLLTIKKLEIKVRSQYVFTFKNGNVEEIGSVWFIAQKDGFEPDELGMFTEALYRYLKANFPKHILNPNYCLAVDVVKGVAVNYSQILKGEIPKRLDSTLEEIKKLM